MQLKSSLLITVGALGLVIAMPRYARANAVILARDSVIPVIVENDIAVRRAREGDRFTAHVDESRDLPFHSRLIGRVLRIHEADGEHPASVELEFTDVILPDGSRHRLDAVPVSLDSKFVTRRADGRMVAKSDEGRQAGQVAAGIVGGFIIGSIIHRQAEATLLGALGGALAATFDHRNEMVLSRGQRIGALIERDQRFESYRGDGTVANGPLVPSSEVVPSSPKDSLHFAYDGNPMQFDRGALPYLEGSEYMVPLQKAATQLGLSVDQNREKIVYVEGDDASMRLEVDSPDVRLNGQRTTLPTKVVRKDGLIYVPIELLAAAKRGNLSVNGNKIAPPSS